MTEDLRRELDSLSDDLQERLTRAGFDREGWLRWASSEHDASRRDPDVNRVRGPVLPPGEDDIVTPPSVESPEGKRLSALGEAALGAGELAFCVMAGGMATRMGGVVKALVECLDGRHFLDLRLAENAATGARFGRPVPLWLMTSDATDAPLRDELDRFGAPAHVRTFPQTISLRLTPEGHLFRSTSGAPSTYATGHGDLVDSLRRSGLLRTFREGGGKYVWIANLDNLGASPDPLLLGLFIARASKLLVEVCDKREGDKGGGPVHVGRTLQVLEDFRLPRDFDPNQVRVFNTNTFLVSAASLETEPFHWTYVRVEKQVDGRPAVQFERLLQEITAALPAVYVRVPRDGAASRFLPVKDPDELVRRRGDLEAVARARGMR